MVALQFVKSGDHRVDVLSTRDGILIKDDQVDQMLGQDLGSGLAVTREHHLAREVIHERSRTFTRSHVGINKKQIGGDRGHGWSRRREGEFPAVFETRGTMPGTKLHRKSSTDNGSEPDNFLQTEILD